MSIKSKLLGAIFLANIATSVIVLIFFFNTGNRIIDKNVEIQSKEIEANIQRNFQEIIDGVDHINYLLITDNHDALKKAAQQPEIKQDTFESVMLQRGLQEEVTSLYRFQKYLVSYSVYSQYNLLLTKGARDERLDGSFLTMERKTSYSINDDLPLIPVIVRPMKLGEDTSVHAVATVNIVFFLTEQFTNLPVGSKLEAYNLSGELLDEIGTNDSVPQETVTRTFNAPGDSMSFKLTLPVATFRGTLAENLWQAILVCGGIVLLTTLLVTVIVLKITHNIGILNQAMNRVSEKQLDTKVLINSNDELQTMGAVFNEMVTNINQLMAENEAQQQEKKAIEMDFLQSQINPHFLSNTLNSITWMAELQEATHIANLSKSLVTLLHASMYKGKDLISLSDELQHVKSYVAIQQVAYMNNFEVHYQIPPSLLDAEVLRFVLQPLVENSILHNFVQGDKQGEITVAARREEELLILEVIDNGNGLETLPNSVDRSNKRYSKIGVANIDKRIKLYFGDDYGLHYETELGRYTRAIVTIPYINDQQGSEE